MRLYLITHAHTRQEPHRDARTWPLSSQGQRQARALARLSLWQDVGQIVLSSEAKTRLTVDPLLRETPIATLEDSRFDELHRVGWFEGDYADHVAAVFAQPARSLAGWEPAQAALARFAHGVDDLLTSFPGACLALISHGLVLSLYRAFLLGQAQVDPADWRCLGFCAVATVDPVNCVLLQDFEAVLDDGPRA